jgi:hypothetical protein
MPKSQSERPVIWGDSNRVSSEHESRALSAQQPAGCRYKVGYPGSEVSPIEVKAGFSTVP